MFVSSLSECHSDTLCYTYCLNLLCSFSKIYLFVYLVNLSLPVCTCSWWPGDNSFSPASPCRGRLSPSVSLLFCILWSTCPGSIQASVLCLLPIPPWIAGIADYRLFQKLISGSHQKTLPTEKSYQTPFVLQLELKLRVCKRFRFSRKKSMLAGENEDPRCHWSYRSRTRLVLFGHRLQKQSKNMKALLLWWPMLGLSTEPPYSHVTLQLLNSFWICLSFVEVRYWACLHRGQHLVPTDYLNFRAFFSSGTHHSA